MTTDNTPFSLNNIRVHLSEIPEAFSKKLKAFITRQPDFNDAVQQLQEKQQKRILTLEQQLLQMTQSNTDLSRQVEALKKSVSTLSEQVAQFRQPVINITTQEKDNGTA